MRTYNTVLILGGGKFGTNALRALSRKSIQIIVVDKDPHCPASKIVRLACTDPSRCGLGSRLIVDDAAAHVMKLMKSGDPPDVIVPAVPGNLMAQLFFEWFSDLGFVVEPDRKMLEKAIVEIPEGIVLKTDPSAATLVLSYAKDFLCAPRCSEPEICPVTGRPIPEPIHSMFTRFSHCVFNKVFRSELVADDVGAVDGREVYDVLNELNEGANNFESLTFCVGTACKCHGIVTFSRCTRARGEKTKR